MNVAEFAEAVDRDGYAIVEKVIERDVVKGLCDAIAALPEGEHLRRRRNVYGVRNLLEICPAVRRLAAEVEIRRWVAAVLGEECFAVRATFFDKVAGANWSLGWHQDSVISVRERIDVPGFLAWSQKAGVWQVQPPAEVLAGMLAIRVHLDDCDATNGPLRVLPGSHTFGWLDEEIEDWKRRVAPVTCCVGAGGVVAMPPLLLHASSPATRVRRRRVIHIEFARDELPAPLQWSRRIAAHQQAAHPA